MEDLLATKNSDAAMITETDNVFYFTGLTGIWGETSPTVLIVSEGTRELITVEMEEERVELETGLSPLTIPRLQDRENFITSYLREELGTQSILFDSMSFEAYEKIRTNAWRLESISGKILQMRSVKYVEELETMRRSAEITVDALSKVPEMLKPGMKETELAAELEYYAKKIGAASTAYPTIVASAERSSLPHGEASQKRIPRDSIVLVDFGVRYNGYCSDFTRVFTTGNPQKRLLRALDKVIEAFEKSIERLVSGADAKEAYEEALLIFKEAGLDKHFLHSLGHGVGINVHELPRISWKEYKLERDQTVTVEPGLYFPGIGGVRVEDTFLIDEEGAEPLAKLDYEIK